MFSTEVIKQYLTMEIIAGTPFWCVPEHFKHCILLNAVFQIDQTDILILNDMSQTIEINTTLVKVLIYHWVVMGDGGSQFLLTGCAFLKKIVLVIISSEC